MIQTIMAIIWLPVLLLLVIWLLHVGGLRSSPTLSAFEDRFPGLADFLNVLPIDKLERLGTSPPPRPVIWLSRIFAILGALTLIVIGMIALFQLVSGGQF